ncbi:hypothetical protein BGZ63DRAFT_385017 [Mariannaea sp. PMI_226]|nr:hypothetical protein BGZ63DRAFT_385017 [Mariannaea sp. PMI_226]
MVACLLPLVGTYPARAYPPYLLLHGAPIPSCKSPSVRTLCSTVLRPCTTIPYSCPE